MQEQNVNEKEPMNDIKFADGSVPVAVAARVYGKEAPLGSSRNYSWVVANRNSNQKRSGCKNYKRNGFKIW